MKDVKCQSDDFYIWLVPRTYGDCYQGEEIYYTRKKSSAMCFDDREHIMPTIKTCPCCLEDFHWYHYINSSKQNYYSKDNVCIWDPLSGMSEPNKTCRDGGRAVKYLNG
ncbi:hypothetical protein RF11_16351 [Thelohanellus kitauei]|uniref:Sortilin C-terminal domain-containing protein n=1 Tax=Thelohanellus kitauei TaxID=669202 RepID=A0A0C2MGT2_THEKT|nr:hypothetical protein RF11_16351 [Thelohanellus kitauei]